MVTRTPPGAVAVIQPLCRPGAIFARSSVTSTVAVPPAGTVTVAAEAVSSAGVVMVSGTGVAPRLV